MAKNYWERLDELKHKDLLDFSEIGEILEADTSDVDVYGAIIQYSELDNFDKKLPNTIDTWIEIALAMACAWKMEKRPDFLNLQDVSPSLGIDRDDILAFLKLRHYIYEPHEGEFHVTVLGLETGVIERRDNWDYLSKKGIKRLVDAFYSVEVTDEEKKRIEAICAEAEKKARYNGVGRAE